MTLFLTQKSKMFNFDYSYLTLPPNFFSLTKPDSFQQHEVFVNNQILFRDLQFSTDQEQWTKLLFEKQYHTKSYAQAYAGHQFGHFTKLGDGRAIIIGEHLSNNNQRFDIQLKGAGRTIYSRGGDGKATLYAMLREYLISEAMHYLNVSTSRSLSVIQSGEFIQRKKIEKGGILVRMMKSHLRVGTFEYAAYLGSKEDLQALTTYTIRRLYPDLLKDKIPALSLLKKVMNVQIDLVINWMRVGFIHGVMNTDNTSISGETFDYGPCAFINTYHPNTCYSSIDHNKRYAFGNQPYIIRWNILRFAETLLPIIHKNKKQSLVLVQQVIDQFDDIWQQRYYEMMCKKIGIETSNSTHNKMVEDLLKCMQKYQLDYTNTFLNLSQKNSNENIFSNNDEFLIWHENWKKYIEYQSNMDQAKKIMQTYNPIFIPRNHLVENALNNATEGNLDSFNRLLNVLSKPYDYQKKLDKYIEPCKENFEKNYKTYCGT